MSHPIFDSLRHKVEPLVRALSAPSANACLVGTQTSSLALTLTVLMHTPPPQAAQAHPVNAPALPAHSGLLVVPTEEEASRLYEDLLFFHGILDFPQEPLLLFPQRGDIPYEPIPPALDLISQRMRTLWRLHQTPSSLVVASVQAVLQRLLPRSVFSDAALSLEIGSVFERDPFIMQLLMLGYQRVSVVQNPGEFSVRGGIVDVFSTAYPDPLRIEFLGDMVESTRLFDPGTQESIEHLTHASILPARECIAPHLLGESLPESIPADGEWRCPDLYDHMDSLTEYFHHPPLLILDRPQAIAKEAERFWDHLLESWDRKESASDHFPYPAPDRLFLTWEELTHLARHCPTLSADPLSAPDSTSQPVVSLPVQTMLSLGLGVKGRSFTDTLATLEQFRSTGTVLVVARNQGQVGRLQSLFAEHQVPAESWHPQWPQSSSTPRQPFYLLHGTLSSGFTLPEERLTLVTEEELFAKAARHRPAAKSKTAKFLSSLDELDVGDYVVHVQHGISQYVGLRRLQIQDFESDYLILQFAGKDTLYVPLDRLNLVQKYRGGEQQTPKLDRLGGGSWAKTTAKVKKAIEDMAEELVELYASREITTREAYKEDTLLTHEFEAAFDYEETPDQLRVIQEIYQDLQSPKPMDRLVCGDVGYGKTEVAMRASFKAVQDNRQVAVLVPTTLLAQQHYENFSKRFAAFPVHIGILSRFQSPKEVKALLQDLRTGVVDIVIGTHRLLQKHVEFQNLGLVVIDEEQWFGVRHKERLKQLRTQVDVLTLTATPIPRTLQMAFSGVRDLSVIDTPPPGRLAIQTRVLRFDPTLIREAIRRELERGGQTFYIHNRVQTMERTATWLKELVPEARIVMAHGQMPEHVLEHTMLTFFHGEADILVASAIIQSGLDVPNANTILVDRADTFGLAQLYQIRGRVGRAGEQAYAYFFFPTEETLSTDAQKRLQAIQEFADLGSGFRIAAADLEIRGSGHLLGKQQSGNIAAVGIDLYLQMVEDAVHHLKGMEAPKELDPVLHLNVSAYIPETYIDDHHQRLSLYKRLTASQQMGDLALLHGETQDRYGPLPQPVERLFEVMQIRLLAKLLRIESLEMEPGGLIITIDEHSPISTEGWQWLIDSPEREARMLTPRSCRIEFLEEDWPATAQAITDLLQTLKTYADRPASDTATAPHA